MRVQPTNIEIRSFIADWLHYSNLPQDTLFRVNPSRYEWPYFRLKNMNKAVLAEVAGWIIKNHSN